MASATADSRKPNFFIVGALKAGTTAWFEYLRSHPDIFMPDLKEPSFFTTDLPHWRRVKSEAEYLQLFEDSGGAKVVGEASPMQLISKTAAKAIRNFNPAAKVLILLRAQEDYLPSLHNQFLLQFTEEIDDFEKAWRLSPCRRPETVPPTCAEPRLLDYRAMGRFHEQVSRYLDSFPPDQIRVMWFHDWIADPRSAYLEVLRFLGVDDDGRRVFQPANEGVSYHSRTVARLLFFPPAWVRTIARALKRVFGLRIETQTRLVDKLVSLVSKRGYPNQISPELRDEIRRYYAEDNRMLEERLCSGPSSTLETVCPNNAVVSMGAGSRC